MARVFDIAAAVPDWARRDRTFSEKTVLSLADLALRRPRKVDMPRLGRDVLAGIISAVMQIAYCVSFAALIFTGEITGGFSLGLAALITGTAITCVVVALTSSFSPANGGPDSPTVAVMSVVAGSVAAGLAAKGVNDTEIVVNVLVALSVSTLFVGLFLFGIGALKLGQWLRFIPYPVIGGFLAASGLLLITGGIEVVTQSNLTLSPSSWGVLYSPLYAPQLIIGALFATSIPLLGRWVPSYLVLPLAFFAYLATLDVGLFGFVKDEAVRSTWFLPSLGELTLWWPIAAVLRDQIDWGVIAQSSAEIGSFCGVAAIALLLDVSSLEVARQKSADLDQEFRSNGIANLFSSVLGGFGGSLSMNGCLLLEESGSVTRWSGVFIGVACAVVLFASADIGSFVPKAILGGILAYLGAAIIVELVGIPVHRSWIDWALAIAMMLIILNFGYFMGVVLGVIGACLMFALSYSRIGVIRRHLTRSNFASDVERSPEQSRLLREEGKRMHLFWLSGFIFFGSSSGLFERIKGLIEAQRDRPVDYVVLDFAAVSGLDSSAMLSLAKLRHYCDVHDVTLAFAGPSKNMRASLVKTGFLRSRPHQVFDSGKEAIEWCEDMLLMQLEVGAASPRSWEDWLAAELDGQVGFARIASNLERRELKKGEYLFRQGEPSDSMVLQASGCLVITIDDELGRPVRLRRMIGHTVVGEMGFYRDAPRAANVIAEEPTVVYRLTRESFERMENEDPDAAAAFDKLIIRLLADRLDFANREVSALL